MNIYTKGADLNEVLFLVPDGEPDGEVLTSFARPDEPLVAVLKKDPSYQYPHIEIRREGSCQH